MSYFDDASLVMIPSGYKDQKVYSVKPTDGTGDFTFTRSNDTATRVGPDGLIEKVRTNLILQSNTFSTTWIASDSSVTSGQAGYDGSSDAWLLTTTALNGSLYQSNTTSGLTSFSCYAKAGTSGWIRLRFDNTSSTDTNIWVNLSNGSIGTNNGISSYVQSVGSGWYRIVVNQNAADLNNVRIYASDSDGNNSTSGTIYIQNAQLEVGDIATQYLATTTAPVSTGPVSGLPRLDYLNSSCPRLLLEPQRTNLALYSEQFDNAGWTKLNSTVSANQTQDPSGYVGADKLVQTSATAEHSIYNTVTVASGTTYTASVFLKIGDGSTSWPYAQVRFRNGGFGTGGGVVADLLNGTISYSSGLTSSSIQSYGNGWYRVSITQAASVNSASAGVVVAFNDTSNSFSVVFAGDTDANMFLFGGQLEAGSYPTSYIPTYGAAVTRGADDLDTTFLTPFDTSSGGTAFFHMKGIYNSGGDTQVPFRVRKDSGNYVGIGVSGAFWRTRITTTSSGTIADISSVSQTDEAKIAIAWSSSGYAIYVNGVQEDVGTDSIADIDEITDFFSSLNDDRGAHGMKQFLLIPSKLSNADLAALTA